MTSTGYLDPSGPFTAARDPAGEAFMRELLGKVVEIVLDESAPRGVYLQGSFGRGEGTVGQDASGAMQLWRDVDLVLVYRMRERPSVIERMRQRCMELPGVQAGDTTIAGADISIAQLPKVVATRWRDLKMLELATRSVHLAGHDIRPSMAAGRGEIPLESGQRFLHQKAIGLSLIWPLRGTHPYTSNYEISKAYIELASALALAEGRPSAVFEERLDALTASADPRVRSLGKRAAEWSRLKAAGDHAALEKRDPYEAWNAGREDLLLGLSILQQRLEGRTPDWHSPEGLDQYYRALVPRFIPTTLAAATARSWPPGIGARALGTTGRLAYGLLARARLGTRTGVLNGCPMAAIYTAAVAITANLDDGDEDRARALASPFFERLGSPLPEGPAEAWTPHVEHVFYRLAKPLYGGS